MKKTTRPPDAGVILSTVREEPRSYAGQSIASWRRALRSFENIDMPVRKYLYDLYEDILLDGQIEATWGKRKDSVLNRRLEFVFAGERDEQVTELLNSPDMRRIVEELHNSIIYGYTLLQINDIWRDTEQESFRIDFDLIPRSNVHPEAKFECVSKDSGSVTADIKYMEAPLDRYVVYAGNPTDKGLLVKAAPFVIYKRGAQGDWSKFSEMFGIPFREAIYEAFDDATRETVQQALKNWGAGMSLTHPKSIEIKLHEAGDKSGSVSVYKEFIALCDAGISKTVLGNTLTTEQGENGARSLGEVHLQVEDAKMRSDEVFLLSVLNTQFRKILKTFGFDVNGGKICFEQEGEDWELIDRKWRVIGSVMDKTPVSDDYIYAELNIPKPENYDEMKEEMIFQKMQGFDPRAGQPQGLPLQTTGGGEEGAHTGQGAHTGAPLQTGLIGRLKSFFA
ncbi:MAG: DUF935 domain-containing protein [Dysgonamonadaceae bacterium]|nr:DUF935 domain-containing protein [Dysgonamonadaceae bacterium]